MEKIDRAIKFGKSLQGVGRGQTSDIKDHYHKDKGPFWPSNGPVPSMNRIKSEGCVCTGFIALMMRAAGIRMPFLERPPLLDERGDTVLSFGLADTDEWLYHYRLRVEKFSPMASDYPRGTLLLRPYNPFDMGHMSMLIEDSSEAKPVIWCDCIHTIGVSFGEDDPEVVKVSPVHRHHWMYWKGYESEWSQDFGVQFGNVGYYTHVLRPEYYVRS